MRFRIPLGLIAGVFVSMAARADTAGDFAAFRARLAVERRAADRDVSTLQEHLATLKAFRANLTMPAEAAADRKYAGMMAEDERALAAAMARRERIERVIEGAFVGYADEIHGPATRESAEGAEALSRTLPILPGDVIRAGGKGSVMLLFEDGMRVELEPDAAWTLLERTPSESRYRLAQGGAQIRYEPAPVRGVIGQVGLETPTASLRLEPCTLALSLDGANRTHAVLQFGRVQASALPMDPADMGKRWWGRAVAGVNQPESPLGMDQWLRLLQLSGDVRIVRRDGVVRRAKAGADFGWVDMLETGAGATAYALGKGGDRFALRPHSRLKADRKRGRFHYRTDRGIVYMQSARRAPEDPTPEFRTTDTTAEPQDASFEATVAPGRFTEWVFLAGSVSLRSLEKPASR